MGTIFISYRRTDAQGEAGRLYDQLSAHFGADRVFRDLDTIRPGHRFPDEIETCLADCDATVALIGPTWAGGDDESRIREPDDYVRMEIGAALRTGVPVVPVLLRNARMPNGDELPPDIEGLADYQAMEIDAADFHEDVARLIRILEDVVGPRRGWARVLSADRRVRWLAGAASLVVALGAGTVFLPRLPRSPAVDLRSDPDTLSRQGVVDLIYRRDYRTSASNPEGAGLEHDYRPHERGGVAQVEDRATGLVWERGGSGRLVPGGWEGAQARIRELNRAGYGGAPDWRLPTLDEALSLLTSDATGGFHLAPSFDPSAAPFVWTADRAPGAGGWVVYYLDGAAHREPDAFNGYVRAVRSR